MLQLGHNEGFCLKENKQIYDPNGKNIYGSWLISIEFEKRLTDQSEKTYNNNPLNFPNYGEFTPIPEAMLKKLGMIHIIEGNQQQQEEQANVKLIPNNHSYIEPNIQEN